MNKSHILRNGELVECDFKTFIEDFGKVENRKVDFTKIGDVDVSTVYLGTFFYPDTPFETMVFGGIYNELQERHATFAEAKIMHRQIVDMVKNVPNKKVDWPRTGF